MLERIRSWARRVKRDAMTLWFASRHPGTPWQVKALSLFVVGYALSPIDLIPDFIPVIGYRDVSHASLMHHKTLLILRPYTA